MAIEIHHLVRSGRRLGHDHVVPLCHYHHQGKFLPGDFTSYKAASGVFGPSLEREPSRFMGEFPNLA